MQRRVKATILFWGDYEALRALEQAVDDSFSESAAVFSTYEDLFSTTGTPRSIVAVLCPPDLYGHAEPPEPMAHSNPMVDVDIVPHADLIIYYRKNRNTITAHRGLVLLMHVPEYAPKIKYLIAFCLLRKELFEENINFKIMYVNYEEDTCGEAVYIDGEEIVSETRDISEMARDMAYEDYYSNDVFSSDMWDRLSDWISDYIYEANREKEEQDARDREDYETYEEDEEDEEAEEDEEPAPDDED